MGGHLASGLEQHRFARRCFPVLRGPDSGGADGRRRSRQSGIVSCIRSGFHPPPQGHEKVKPAAYHPPTPFQPPRHPPLPPSPFSPSTPPHPHPPPLLQPPPPP